MKVIGYIIFDKSDSSYLASAVHGALSWHEDHYAAFRFCTEAAATAMRNQLAIDIDDHEFLVWPVCGLCGQPGECKPVIGTSS